MEPPQCFTCGTPLSAKWDAFVAMRKLITKKEILNFDDEKTADLKDIFYVLGIEDNNYHCPTGLMTCRLLKDYLTLE